MPSGSRAAHPVNDYALAIMRIGSFVSLEPVLGNDHAARADKSIGPKRGRLGKIDTDRMVVYFRDLNIFVDARGRCRGVRISGVLPVKDTIVSGEGLAIMPPDTLL